VRARLDAQVLGAVVSQGVRVTARLHELLADLADAYGEIVIGIESDRGLWVRPWSAPAFRSMRSIPRPWPAIRWVGGSGLGPSTTVLTVSSSPTH
jgi:hypothetical protein